MSALAPMRVSGVGAFAPGLPDWPAMRAFIRGEAVVVEDAPRRPAPDLLPSNERRRAPDTVLLALAVAQAACRDAGADPSALPSVFASTHGDLGITDYMCRTLASAPQEISPTRFHNSVHNAAAGYWTIGVGCHATTTALSAYGATFAQGLIEAAMLLEDGAPQVLLVAYDGEAVGPLGTVTRSQGLFGTALVLSHAGAGPVLDLRIEPEAARPGEQGVLQAHVAGNAMRSAAVVLEALALDRHRCELEAGPQLGLVLEIARHD